MEWDRWPIKKRSLKLNVTKIITVLLSQQYSKQGCTRLICFLSICTLPLSTYMKGRFFFFFLFFIFYIKLGINYNYVVPGVFSRCFSIYSGISNSRFPEPPDISNETLFPLDLPHSSSIISSPISRTFDFLKLPITRTNFEPKRYFSFRLI